MSQGFVKKLAGTSQAQTRQEGWESEGKSSDWPQNPQECRSGWPTTGRKATALNNKPVTIIGKIY